MNERDLFIEALQMDSPDLRDAFLKGQCGDDAELYERIKGLLQLHDQDGSFLHSPPKDLLLTIDAPFTEGPGATIGPYKLLQQIGEGGMGTVFMAEQTEPVQRKVALKIIKPGMDSKQVLARFEAERQALALMDHPNIAHVYDAGSTGGKRVGNLLCEPEGPSRQKVPDPFSAGRPYFVMELVKGKPISKYCDDHSLTVKERLALFVPVCRAIQHAHQKGVIHRDLKPSNILVALYDGKPAPKVIDFGIAKATGGKLSQQTLFTEFGSMIGTLQNKSPDKSELNQLDIDTRSDVYSLGVVLYELLTGTTPLDRKRVKGGNILELLQCIREGETPRPSTRLSTIQELETVAEHRRVEPKKLSGVMRGELDWIVMKALEKERARRYESASAFAADIQRYLNDEQVLACPPSFAYRMRKFSRRYRVGLVTTGLVAAALVLGAVISTWQAIRATGAMEKEKLARQGESKQRKEAVKNLKQANENLLLAEDNLGLAMQALDKVYLTLLEFELPRQPHKLEENRRLLESGLGFYTKFAERNANNPSARFEQAVAYSRAGEILQLLRQSEKALAALNNSATTLDALLRTHPKDLRYLEESATVYLLRGRVLAELCQFDKAALEYDKATKIVQTWKKSEAASERMSLLSFQLRPARCSLFFRTGRFAEGKKYLDGAIKNSLVELENPPSEFALEQLRLLHYHQILLLTSFGELEKADQLSTKLIQSWQKLIDGNPNDPEYLFQQSLARFQHGVVLTHLGRYKEARKVTQEAVKAAKILVNRFPSAPVYTVSLAKMYCNLDATNVGGLPSDSAWLDEAIKSGKKLTNEFPKIPDHWLTLAQSHNNYGVNLEADGQWKLAKREYAEGLKIVDEKTKRFPGMPAYRELQALLLFNLADVQQKMGNEEAGATLSRCVDVAGNLAKDHPEILDYQLRLAHYRSKLAIWYRGNKQPKIAEPIQRDVLEFLKKLRNRFPQSGRVQADLARAYLGHGNLFNDLEKFDDALKAFATADEEYQHVPDLDANAQARANHAKVYNNRGDVFRTTKRYKEARDAYKTAIQMLEKITRDSPTNLDAKGDLCSCLDHFAISEKRAGGDALPLCLRGINEAEKLVELSCNPRFATILTSLYSTLTYVRFQNKEYQEAEKIAGKTINLAERLVRKFGGPKHLIELKKAIHNQITVTQRSGNYELRIHCLRRMIKLGTQDPKYFNSLAWELATCRKLQLRNPDEAVKLARKAVELQPQNANYVGTLGTALFRAGDFDEAATRLEKAIQLHQGEPRGTCFDRFFLAMAYSKLKQETKAKTEFSKAAVILDGTEIKDDITRNELQDLRNEAAELLKIK